MQLRRGKYLGILSPMLSRSLEQIYRAFRVTFRETNFAQSDFRLGFDR